MEEVVIKRLMVLKDNNKASIEDITPITKEILLNLLDKVTMFKII